MSHEAHEGPCLPLGNQAGLDTPQGICDECGHVVTERGRSSTISVAAPPGTVLPRELLRALVRETLARQGLRYCRTCQQTVPA